MIDPRRLVLVSALCVLSVFICEADEPVANASNHILDYGEVSEGKVLRPCVRITNKSTHPVRVQHVRPTCANIPPFDTNVEPGQQVIKELPPLDTRGFVGPFTKQIVFRLTPPSVVDMEILDSCGEPG